MSVVMLSAADASGEMHAADLARALQGLCPALRLCGLGGDAMRRAGVELLVEQRELAVGGFALLWTDLPRVLSAFRRMFRALKERRPQLLVLVDSPDFNLPLARRAQRLGIPVLYYISPQVWAWRSGRIRKIARRVNRMAVIFPFEVEVYAGTGLPVTFVGHPLVERLGNFAAQKDRAQCRLALGLDDAAPLVALFPGSRRNEVAYNLPLQLAAARALHARAPQLRFAVACAPSIGAAQVKEHVAAPCAGAAPLPAPALIENESATLMRAADVVLAKPGTATLEAAVIGTPLAVAARVGAPTMFVMRRLLRVSRYALPNLVAGRTVVPEFIQEQAHPERIAEALQGLLAAPQRELQLREFAEISRRLGEGDAAQRTAEIAVEMLNESTAT